MIVQVAADLRAAAEVLRRDGWTQGFFTDPTTGWHCFLGAFDQLIAENRLTEDREDDMWKFFVEASGIHNVVVWNDAPGRTADEVIAALEAAADAAEADL